jgi:hypothetical protein
MTMLTRTSASPTHSPRPTPALVVPAAVAALTLLATGCTGGLNQGDGLDGVTLPDLTGRMPGPEPTGEPQAPTMVDRAAWTDTTTILVVQRQVEVQPTYVSEYLYGTPPARSTGAWPTTTTALETDTNGGARALEGVAAPAWAAWDILVAPVRVILQPPGTTLRAPAQPPTLERPALLPGTTPAAPAGSGTP